MTFRRTPRAFPSLLVVLALVAGCSQAPPRQTEFMERLAAEGVTVRELQVEVYNFAIYFNDLVEDAADRIYARTDDPVLRDRALLWKMSAIPKMQRAAFREDPLAGLISAWSFCVQLRNWFETGPGREHFGEHQSVALGAVIEAAPPRPWRAAFHRPPNSRTRGVASRAGRSPTRSWDPSSIAWRRATAWPAWRPPTRSAGWPQPRR